MELTIKDRLYFPAILPKEGTFREYNHKKEILRKIDIDSQERDKVGLKEDKDTGRIEWDVTKDVPLSVEFSKDEMAYLKASCEKLSDQNLPDDMWGTVEKIYDSGEE